MVCFSLHYMCDTSQELINTFLLLASFTSSQTRQRISLEPSLALDDGVISAVHYYQNSQEKSLSQWQKCVSL